MMKKYLFFTVFLLCFLTISAQSNTKLDRPKLVVGIVVDQMRYDYLTRFYEKYGDDGFKLLLRDGFNCENAHFNYIPTYTAVGHASVYTGTTPSMHGIIGNDWYDKTVKKSLYCVDDDSFTTVGTEKGGKKSPKNLLTTTITDELRLAQNMQGKTISISIKDRSAILPGGHTANAAYWFEGKKEGKFISSSYYMNELPKWVVDFNSSKTAKKYLNQKWDTYYKIKTYTESIDDDNDFERAFTGEKAPVFPHDLEKLAKENGEYDILKATPFGNSIVVDFAKEAIKEEKLGKGDFTDFLAISFSSTDYVGHQFGVDSKEVEDTYIRLDKDIADFISYLNKNVGQGNYTLFLTADHAAVQVPAYLKSVKIPGTYIDSDAFKVFLKEKMMAHFNADDLIENFSNFQFFLDKEKIKALGLNVNEVAQILADEIITYDGILNTVTAQTMQNTNFPTGILHNLQNGYNQKLSGDILVIPNPATISYSKTGSTHGSGFSYDTHVPIIFFGKGIQNGVSKDFIPIVNIAPTLANLLQVEFPNGNSGTVIKEALK
jgi:predicted AlkP superfamily pyrophosphatase or phosphodiesterase